MLVFNAKPDALLEKLLPNYNPLKKMLMTLES